MCIELIMELVDEILEGDWSDDAQVREAYQHVLEDTGQYQQLTAGS